MRRKLVHMYLAVAAAALMGMSVPALAAETDTAAETGAESVEAVGETEGIAQETAAETEAESAEAVGETEETAAETEALKEAEDIRLEVDEKEIVIVNEAKVKAGPAEVEEEKDGDLEDGSCTVILTVEEGQHVFEHVIPENWTDPRLVEDHGFLYIQYTDAEGNSREALETADAVVLEEELTMWAVTDVNMRREASSDSEVAAVAGLSDECTVTGILPGWYQVEYNGETGYINHKFLSDDKDAVDAAVKQEEAAIAAAEAAAAARNAANSYSFSGSGSGKKSGGSSKGSSGSGKSEEECLTNGLLN